MGKDRIIVPLAKTTARLGNPIPPGPLYHYCSQSGLQRIIKDRYLSATSIHYFNDAKELSYALDLLEEVCADLVAKEPGKVVETLLHTLLVQARLALGLNVFVFCFSEDGDLLSQWRGYCPEGNGYSIGFDADLLIRLGGPGDFIMLPCIYDPTQQRALLSDTLEILLYSFERDMRVIRDGGGLNNLEGLDDGLTAVIDAIIQASERSVEEGKRGAPKLGPICKLKQRGS